MMLSDLSCFMITFSSPGTIAFYIGNWPIRWYGILIAIAFLGGYFLAEKLIKRSDLSLNHFSNLIFFILVFGILFARLWFVFLSWDYFKVHIGEVPKIWLGGQSIHGGILGAIIASVIYTRLKKISFYKYMDVIAVVTPLGQAIGRWGNFFNNEAFGKPVSNWFLRLYIPTDSRPLLFRENEFFHPTFLYESILDFLLFIFLYKKYSSWREAQGRIFWVYLLCYSSIRFLLEFIRIDSLYLVSILPAAQLVSIITVLISLIVLVKNYKRVV